MTKPQTDVGIKQVKNYGRGMFLYGFMLGIVITIIVQGVLK